MATTIQIYLIGDDRSCVQDKSNSQYSLVLPVQVVLPHVGTVRLPLL